MYNTYIIHIYIYIYIHIRSKYCVYVFLELPNFLNSNDLYGHKFWEFPSLIRVNAKIKNKIAPGVK